jgi:hypothetical protein
MLATFALIVGVMLLSTGANPGAASPAAPQTFTRNHVPAGYAGAPFGDSRNVKAPQRIPGRLQGELFDTGEAGVAYSDSDGKNSGSGALNPIDGSYLNGFRASEASSATGHLPLRWAVAAPAARQITTTVAVTRAEGLDCAR